MSQAGPYSAKKLADVKPNMTRSGQLSQKGNSLDAVCTALRFMETVICESRGQSRVFQATMERRFRHDRPATVPVAAASLVCILP